MIQACLFDMDGVLVDTARFHFLSWQRLAESLGIGFSREQNEELKGVSRAESLEKILHWGNKTLEPSKKEELMQLKNGWYLDYVDGLTKDDILPGVATFLNELKSNGIKIGLGSSSKNAVAVLNKLGIMPFFDTVIDGNKISRSKPDPEIFLKGAEALNVSPANTIVFEDAQSGVRAAIDGGFRCVGIGDAAVLSEATIVIPSFQSFGWKELRERVG